MRLRNVRTTNVIDSFFGSYKVMNVHEILTIDQCVNSIVIRYRMLISKSLAIKKNDIPKKIYSGRLIGEEAKMILNKEYDKMEDKIQQIFLNKISEDDYLSECNCSVIKEFGLPCEHLLFGRYKTNQNPLLSEEDIPNIYFQSQFNEDLEIDEVRNVQTQNKKVIEDSYSYTQTMSDLSIIAEDAKRNLDARKIVTGAINDHKKLLISNGEKEPPQIKRFGRASTHPSKNVNSALIKKKNVVRLIVHIANNQDIKLQHIHYLNLKNKTLL